MGACIQISKLTKRYGSTVAVDDLSIEVQSGEVLGLLGPNGAGKSTTLYMLAGLARPTSGTITLFGKDLRRDFIEIAGRIGVLVERPAFYEYLSPRENLLILARLAGREVTIDRALNLTGLLEVAGKKTGTLSMGMRQRLGLAQALLLEPEILILDEPANGLDPESTQETIRLLRQLAVESHVTIIFSSHMLHEVEELCDRVAIINNGRLVSCERMESLLSYDLTRVEVLLDAPAKASTSNGKTASAVAERLREQDWVLSAEAVPGKVLVTLKEPNPQQLAAFMVGAGYRLAGIVPRRRTLQDYFTKTLNP